MLEGTKVNDTLINAYIIINKLLGQIPQLRQMVINRFSIV